MSEDKISSKMKLLSYTSVFALSLCVVYTIFSLASSIGAFSLVDKILFGSAGIAVWAIAVFFLLVQLGYNLELHLVDGHYVPALAITMLVIVTAIAIGVVLVGLGFVGIVAISSIGIVLLSLCLLFSAEFFKMKRLPFSLRLIIATVIISVVVGIAGFLT